MNNTIKELKERKSVRQFTDKEIDEETKEIIFDAIVNAPSGGNMQSYSVIDVVDQEIKEKLAVLCDNQPFIKDAKMVLIFCTDFLKYYDAFSYNGLNPRKLSVSDLLLAIEDASIAAQNAVTAAYSLGIGSCYIGDVMENHDEMVKLLGLPDYVYPACMLVFGYPTKSQIERKKPQRVDNKFIFHKNQYKRLDKDELKEMLEPKALNNTYERWIENLFKRKYDSDFSYEMANSTMKYLKPFLEEE